MSISNDEFKTSVLAATDLVELIGRSVALKRRGKDFVGLCPFHQEKSPSFSVNPAKQFFFCYGCKKGGDAITFVMERDRIEFIEALKQLGEAAGIEMPKFGVSKQKIGERQQLLDAHSQTCSFFEKLLAHPELGRAGREYLEKRGINEDSIKRFQIGLSPDGWDGLLRGPVGRKFPPGVLSLAGLVKSRERGDGHYDTFRNRLIFPIRDESGRVIAFGGREMPGAENPPKYLNSPETPLFSKSKCVFGLDLARQRIVETRTVAIVEGYTDVVMAHQFGVSNVVSPLGTALTEQHVSILRRFADRIVLLFDADTAGDVAVDRAVGLFLTQPVEIAIASMPEGVDPDEFLLKEGAEAFNQLLATAPDALTFKWKQLDKQFRSGQDDLTGQQKAVEAYLGTLSAARNSGPVDPMRWGHALSRVSRLTEIPVDQLNRQFSIKAPRSNFRGRMTETAVGQGPSNGNGANELNAAGPTLPSSRNASAQEKVERWLLGILFHAPGKWHDVQQKVSIQEFKDPLRQKLAELYWEHQRHEGEPVFNEFLGLLQDSSLKEVAIQAYDEVESLAELDNTLSEAIAHLERGRQHRDEQKLVAELRRPDDQRGEQDEVALLKQLQDSARRPNLRRV